MGKVPHGCARTTPVTRLLIQQSTESLQKLATRFSIDPKTVAKGVAVPRRKRPCAAPNRPPPCSRRRKKRPSSCFASRPCCPLMIAFTRSRKPSQTGVARRCTVACNATASAACHRAKRGRNPKKRRLRTTPWAICTSI